MGDKALKLVEENDIQTRAAVAQAKLTELESSARAAEHAEQIAVIAHRDAPDVAAAKRLRAAKDDAEDAARITRRDADSYGAEIAPLLDAAKVAHKEQEFAALTPKVQGVTFATQMQRVEDLVADFRRQLRGTLVDLHDAITVHNGHVSRANQLATDLSRSERYSTRTLDDVIVDVALSLNGGVREAIGYPTELTLKSFTLDGDERSRRFLIQINGNLTK